MERWFCHWKVSRIKLQVVHSSSLCSLWCFNPNLVEYILFVIKIQLKFLVFFFPIPFPLYYSASLLQSTYPNFLMIFGFPFKIPVTKFHLFELLVNYISNHFYSMPAQECYIYTKCLFKMLYSVCNVPIVIVFKIFNTHPNFFFFNWVLFFYGLSRVNMFLSESAIQIQEVGE